MYQSFNLVFHTSFTLPCPTLPFSFTLSHHTFTYLMLAWLAISFSGSVWSKMVNPHENWEVEVVFRVNGRGRIGADGLVRWRNVVLHKCHDENNNCPVLYCVLNCGIIIQNGVVLLDCILVHCAGLYCCILSLPYCIVLYCCAVVAL